MKNEVTVLMSTYNGEKYIKEQIDSILQQQNIHVNLLVRDDGSNDRTLEILDRYSKENLLKYYAGKNLKTARSFLKLLQDSPDSQYYAFSDQDDIWKPNKLIRAITMMKKNDDKVDQPILYAGSFQMTDENLHFISGGEGHYTTSTFANAIVYSCCTGCTMVMNKALRDLVNEGGIPDHLLMHDDWVHKVCLAMGGKVVFDDKPFMLYRQHGNNVDGGIHTFHDKVRKVWHEKKSRSRIMSGQLTDLFEIYGNKMPHENRKLLLSALKRGKGNLWARMRLAFDPQYAITKNRNLNHEFRVSLLLNDW